MKQDPTHDIRHERNLIERAKKGDFNSYRQLVERYESRLYSVCYGILRNREDALDALQEVLLKVYYSLKKFKGESGLYVWMYRIAVNKSLDFHRARKRVRNVVNKVKDVSSDNTQFYEEDTPADYSLHIELKHMINKAIQELPEQQKSVIILREIEGLSYQEIAKVIGCSQGTVMSRLFYGRKKLAATLKKYTHKDTNETQ